MYYLIFKVFLNSKINCKTFIQCIFNTMYTMEEKAHLMPGRKGQDMTWFVHQNIIVADIDEDYL